MKGRMNLPTSFFVGLGFWYLVGGVGASLILRLMGWPTHLPDRLMDAVFVPLGVLAYWWLFWRP